MTSVAFLQSSSLMPPQRPAANPMTTAPVTLGSPTSATAVMSHHPSTSSTLGISTVGQQNGLLSTAPYVLNGHLLSGTPAGNAVLGTVGTTTAPIFGGRPSTLVQQGATYFAAPPPVPGLEELPTTAQQMAAGTTGLGANQAPLTGWTHFVDQETGLSTWTYTQADDPTKQGNIGFQGAVVVQQLSENEYLVTRHGADANGNGTPDDTSHTLYTYDPHANQWTAQAVEPAA
jgi:hypothetical protein